MTKNNETLLATYRIGVLGLAVDGKIEIDENTYFSMMELLEEILKEEEEKNGTNQKTS